MSYVIVWVLPKIHSIMASLSVISFIIPFIISFIIITLVILIAIFLVPCSRIVGRSGAALLRYLDKSVRGSAQKQTEIRIFCDYVLNRRDVIVRGLRVLISCCSGREAPPGRIRMI